MTIISSSNLPAVFGIDLNGLVNEWNNKTAEITGYTKKEAIGKPLVSRFIVLKLRESVQKVLDNALKGQETSNYELEFRTKSDEVRYLLVNATTRRDEENNIVGVVGVAQVSLSKFTRIYHCRMNINISREYVRSPHHRFLPDCVGCNRDRKARPRSCSYGK